MPELPEVEIVRRGLEPAMVGKAVREVNIRRTDLRVPIPGNFQSVVEGRTIEKISRRGKYILAFFAGGPVMVWHLGMSGRVHIYGPGTSYDIQKHDHVIFKMDDGSVITFNDTRRFGMLYLTNDNHWEKEKPFSVMGPEPLEYNGRNEFHGAFLEQRLDRKRGAIKTALLDQKVVAGVGNIYACEALFESGIHPETVAGDIKGAEAEALTRAVREVLQKAIKAGGSTLKDYQHTDGTLGYFQTLFSVYDREHKKCPGCTCDSGVLRIVQAGRSTFYCPLKQKKHEYREKHE